MIADNYSDEIGNDFEEEYLDEEVEETKTKAPLKNDFWDPPKKQPVSNVLTQKSAVANNAIKNTASTVPLSSAVKN
jgi:hypothetical protein